jgi:hypothetical protein
VNCMAIRGYTIEAYFWVLLLKQCRRKPSHDCTTLIGAGVGTIISWKIPSLRDCGYRIANSEFHKIC